MRNDSTVRVKIIVHDPTWLTRVQAEWIEFLVRVHKGLHRAKQIVCGLRGHDYSMRTHRRRMALHCRLCGHSTVGWELGDPTPKVPPSDRQRYLELLRRRS
jgi:hypothetical protein